MARTAQSFLPETRRELRSLPRFLAPSRPGAESAFERAPWLRRLQVHSETRCGGPSDKDLTEGVCTLALSFSRRAGIGDEDAVAVICVVVFLGRDGRRLFL